MSTYDGPVGGVESRTGPSVYVQWEAASRTIRLLNPPMPVMVNMRSIDPDAGPHLDCTTTKAATCSPPLLVTMLIRSLSRACARRRGR